MPLALPIVGDRVVVDRFADADTAALSRSHSDPGNARYQDWRFPLSEADARSFIDDQQGIEVIAPGEAVQLALRETEAGPLAGDVYLARSKDTPTEVEVGITLVPGFHGRGLATRGIAALVHALRGDGVAPPALRRVVAIVEVGNDRSRALFERLGFQVDGRLEGERDGRDGTPVDEIVYDLEI